MPLYTWRCPQCSKNTRVLNSVADYNNPPDTCDPELEPTGEKGDDGKPTFNHPPSCGFTGSAIWSADNTLGWRKQIGGNSFILKGYSWARDGYS